MNNSVLEQDAVYSSFADDPDMCELADMYADEMPDKIATLEAAFASGDLEELRRKAHQLKGSAGGYGFDQLTPFAATLEYSIRDGKPPAEVSEALTVLISVCRKVRGSSIT